MQSRIVTKVSMKRVSEGLSVIGSEGWTEEERS